MKKTTDLPVFHALLTQDDGSRWNRPYTEHRIQRLDEALTQWSEAMAAGEIENPRFIESKECISRAVEDAWDRVERDHDWINSLSDPLRNALDSCPRPNLSNLGGRLNRVLKAPEHPTRDRLVALIDDLKPVLEAYAFLKAHAKKRVIRSAEEQEATRFTPPPTTSKAVEEVHALLETVVNRDFSELLNELKTSNRANIQCFLDAQDEAYKNPDLLQDKERGYSPRWHLTIKDGSLKGQVMNPEGARFLEKVLAAEHEYGRATLYKADADTWVKSDAQAQELAETIRRQFVFKNLQKITPILERKGESVFESVSEIGNGITLKRMEGDFHFKFNDHSSFNVHNAVVFVVNQFHTRFFRYPLTFHSVTLPNGEAMGRPSEERMNEIFAVATGEVNPSVAGPNRSRRRSP